MLKRYRQFKAAVHAHPKWATQLSVSNITGFCAYLAAIGVLYKLATAGYLTSTWGAEPRDLLVWGGAIGGLTAVVWLARTAYDIRRYWQAKVLVAHPQFLADAMGECDFQARPVNAPNQVIAAHNFTDMSAKVQLEVTLVFLHYLAQEGRRCRWEQFKYVVFLLAPFQVGRMLVDGWRKR